MIDTRINAVSRTVPIPNASFLGAIAPRGADNARLFVCGSNLFGRPMLLGKNNVADHVTYVTLIGGAFPEKTTVGCRHLVADDELAVQ